MKVITSKLSVAGWGPRDPACAWLETLGEMAANRCQWHSCCHFLSRLSDWSVGGDGKPRYWDGVLSHDSVSILLYHVEKSCLLLVKQFRPVIYFNKLREATGKMRLDDDEMFSCTSVPPHSANTVELCAGLIDGTDSDPQVVAAREILEECGFSVDPSSLQLIDSFHSGVGLLGNRMTLFYAELNESQRVPGAGGGLRDEGEFIELIEWPISKIDTLLGPNPERPPCSTSLLYAVSWFKMNKSFKNANHFNNSAALSGMRFTPAKYIDYADDVALLGSDPSKTQTSLSKLNSSAALFDMRSKPANCNSSGELSEDKIISRIGKAGAIFANLRHLWCPRVISLFAKGRVYTGAAHTALWVRDVDSMRRGHTKAVGV
ncbi:Nudix hydrolase 14, chloroplastic [Clonorchis sinensis]|uniref:Uridine diphosphate glucose pyrophosphatase NUDT14 n=1 Tax=Clonorchis sinensis TaxID=79923 RepID=A0A3R7CDX4_CLOSI|nr:Nudix hydrolase 14, chloroplastic [Clonorchis sinensis]